MPYILSPKGIFRINSDLEDASALQRLAFIFIVIMEMLSFILSYIRKRELCNEYPSISLGSALVLFSSFLVPGSCL